jgi:hypothetical protein
LFGSTGQEYVGKRIASYKFAATVLIILSSNKENQNLKSIS